MMKPVRWRKDYKDGKERIIQFLPYPGNYGFIPETLAGDGDPIDVIDLDEAEEKRRAQRSKNYWSP